MCSDPAGGCPGGSCNSAGDSSAGAVGRARVPPDGDGDEHRGPWLQSRVGMLMTTVRICASAAMQNCQQSVDRTGLTTPSCFVVSALVRGEHKVMM